MKNLYLLIVAILSGAFAFAQQVPRPEYPRPQFVRNDWVNLNGTWTYALDQGDSGLERGLTASKGFPGKITVPFCPESKLSGVGYTDFINAMWYHKNISIPIGWKDKKILLHFGGVDYRCDAYIDSQLVATHFGGTSAFTFDITSFVKAGSSHNLVLSIKDDTRSGIQPLGKQAYKYNSSGARYTRTTGIWQTVWMEAAAPLGLESCKIIPDLDQSRFTVMPAFFAFRGQRLRVTVKDGDRIAGQQTIPASNSAMAVIELENIKPWSPENPFLYDFILEVLDMNGEVIDKVTSYAGMRKVHIQDGWVYLNNQPRYLRFVLDQGFYPDGIWTAPTDEAMKHDIELSMQAGFNGARLHQKIFEERFHYWADKMGYLTWAEAADWGGDRTKQLTMKNITEEWIETVQQRINHPSIIGWTPLNELWITDETEYPRFNEGIYNLTKALDQTRPIITAAGGEIYKADIWSVHDYSQDATTFGQKLQLKTGKFDFSQYHISKKARYEGQPIMVSEYGGIKWLSDQKYAGSWGYGKGPKSLDEFYSRLELLTGTILKSKHITGYCFTQLTDVEQEQNGIYTYDRRPKFDMKKVRKVFSAIPSNK
ncbi:sugar-binding domain-containing protein [Mucilaginibacter sp. PAMB04168]|uniref:glycoside hydrolase family 2 protein n=1 Tax=Mucilaginibacter sp. PAMB04168 TaxID=3138567 RepID=UPI0031F72085